MIAWRDRLARRRLRARGAWLIWGLAPPQRIRDQKQGAQQQSETDTLGICTGRLKRHDNATRFAMAPSTLNSLDHWAPLWPGPGRRRLLRPAE